MKKKFEMVLRVLGEKFPNPKTELVARTPFQLLIATLLAAQCTDKRVNIVTKVLFNKCPTVHTMALLTVEEIQTYIKSINYYRTKGKNIKELCNVLIEKYNSKVPSTLDELIKLPGVGRKTAHVVMGSCFGKPVMPVDTHVFRVSHRIGLSSGKTLRETEDELVANIAKEQVHNFHHYLILHGRYTCKAKNPLCHECGITTVCEHFKTIVA